MTVFQRVVVLGSTGSIGESTLDVIARHPERLAVYALSAYTRMQKLAEQALASRAEVVVVPDDAARRQFLDAWPAGPALPEIRVGAQALADTAADARCDAVMAAIVGAAGLPAALAAAGGQTRAAGQQGSPGGGRFAIHAGHPRQRRRIAAHRQRAQRHFQCLPHGGRARRQTRPRQACAACC